MTNPIYLDHNATTPPAPEVLVKLNEWASAWGNPSSIHQAGRAPKALMRWARQEIAKGIGADPLEVVFTSCGSESNNSAIKGAFAKLKKIGKNHIIISRIEHPSVTKAALSLLAEGAEVDFVDVNREGAIDLEKYEALFKPNTGLVSIMLANNETGTILPIKKMAKIAHEKGALFHTDAVQALGKMLFSVKDLDVDMASFSGHKFYALRGAGVLFVKRGVSLEPLIHGGGHERSRRAGTENVLALSSLAEVISNRKDKVAAKIESLQLLRDELETEILKRFPDAKITGAGAKRLASTSSLVIPGIDGEILLMNLDMAGCYVSTGAACSSGAQEPSATLIAMGLSRTEAQSSLRLSLGWDTTKAELDRFVEILVQVVTRIRSLSAQISQSNPSAETIGI